MYIHFSPMITSTMERMATKLYSKLILLNTVSLKTTGVSRNTVTIVENRTQKKVFLDWAILEPSATNTEKLAYNDNEHTENGVATDTIVQNIQTRMYFDSTHFATQHPIMHRLGTEEKKRYSNQMHIDKLYRECM